MKKITNGINKRKLWKSEKQWAIKVYSDNPLKINELHKIKMEDKWDNEFHLSSYSGLINDPNGLVKNKNKYHIFYQWAPYKPTHTLKHWGHFETTDFINYNHTGLAIEPSVPEDANGVYSGGGINFNGKIYVFWTGNVKAFGSPEEDRSAFTLMGEWSEERNKLVSKKPLFEVDKTKYTGHFRDPKPLLINDKFYLLHGAQTTDLFGTISIYSSDKIDANYKLMGNLSIEPKIEQSGYMWECPDYVVIDDQELLVFSPQGKSFYNEGNENRDTVVFVPGKLDIENLVFNRTGPEQVIDEGFDFYAPQTFSNTNRSLLIGWAGIGEADSYATFDNMWAHNLTLTRELTVIKNKVIQNPISEYKNLRNKKLDPAKTYSLAKSRLFEFQAEFNNTFSFKLFNKKDEEITFDIREDTFLVSRENMSFDQAPNYGRTRMRKHYNKFSNIRVFIDNSLIEVYANNGEFVFTSKYWLDGDIKLEISDTTKLEAYKLNKFGMEWNV